MRISAYIPTAAQLRSHEAAWIESCHADWGMVLMELAGRGVAEVALSMLEGHGGPVAIFCGSGNNGGDGLVVARYLYLCGVPITVHMVQAAKKPKPGTRNEAEIHKAVLEELGAQVKIIGADEIDSFKAALNGSALIIDALLGTGLDRPVEGIYQTLIKAINGSGKPVLAVDLPSGINSDSGQVMGVAVQADHTVTFGFLKAGLVNHPGADHCGEITLVDIGLPGFDSRQSKPQWWLSTADRVRNMLPYRPDDSHKGDFGRVLTIAGSLGMSGASIMSSKSALRAGAGLSVLATPKSLVANLPPQEVIYKGIEETTSGTISPKAVVELGMELDQATSVILGPGLSLNVDTVKFVHEIVKAIQKPCVIDADALNAISQNTACMPADSRHFVLTPHPKELARLMGCSVKEIQDDRMKFAQDAANKFNCTVVLKGSRTLVANPDQQVCINPTGNAAMATAGSGDVLSGIIGGLMGQGMRPYEAAVAGVYIHGAAGDMVAFDYARAGIIAGDIMGGVPVIISKIRSGEHRGSDLELQLYGRPRQGR